MQSICKAQGKHWKEQFTREEIGRRVKLDLRLRRIKCKSIYGKNATTNVYSVAVDSRQVSEAVKGLRAVLNKKLSATNRETPVIHNEE